ncbi:hypothetical protein D3C87_2025880 [compost metagenome]
MGGYIVEFAGTISGARDDLAIENDDGADRHFAALARFFGLFQGRIHEACRISHRSNNNFS